MGRSSFSWFVLFYHVPTQFATDDYRNAARTVFAGIKKTPLWALSAEKEITLDVSANHSDRQGLFH